MLQQYKDKYTEHGRDVQCWGIVLPQLLKCKWKRKWSRSVVSNSLRPHGACQAPPSMGFSRQEYWSGLPFPSPGDLPNIGIEPTSPALQVDSLTTRKAQICLQFKRKRKEKRLCDTSRDIYYLSWLKVIRCLIEFFLSNSMIKIWLHWKLIFSLIGTGFFSDLLS